MSSTRAQRADARRTQILSAAAQLFRRNGFTGVGIDDIGAASGVSGPAVYRYFPSKQAILSAVIDGYLDQLEAARLTSGEPPDGPTPRTGERAVTKGGPLLRVLVEVGLKDPDSLAVYLRQLGRLDPSERARLHSRHVAMLGSSGAAPGSGTVDRARPADELRLRACAGVLISVAFTQGVAAPVRSLVAGQMLTALLDTSLPDSADLPTPPPSTAERARPLRHASRREAILAAATEHFREHGFKGVSLKDIGAEVGITASAVSRHFESKDLLLAAMFNRAAEQISAGIAGALAHSPDAAAAVREIIGRYSQLAIECRSLIVINATEMRSLPETQRDQRRRNHRMYIEELRNVIAQAWPELGDDETRLRAASAFGLVNEVIMDDDLSRRPGLVQELTALGIAAATPPPAGRPRS
ncbi:TetR/AcrR family transcriptional regulator [Streptomyces sp. NBC_00656]|uniref:TetR/AcrR family transcriptional regulator n=1 Tax=Streptomyces sp. NBC_00656 TaxID=2903668 RepID=UPI003246EC6C